MNISAVGLEISVVGLGLVTLLVDLWVPDRAKRGLCYGVAALLAVGLGWLILELIGGLGSPEVVMNGMLIIDGASQLMKALLLAVGIAVALLVAESEGELSRSAGEYLSIVLFGLAGMLFAVSAQHFASLFVAIELITVSFYILVSFDRSRWASVEAGVKYLIMGAMSSAILVFGIALVYGSTSELRFDEMAYVMSMGELSSVYALGLFFVVLGLTFKVAAFPFHLWASDVYQGAPIPTTAFLAMGSKAAGVVALTRLLVTGVPIHEFDLETALMVIACLTILVGNLCALFQTSFKRLLGYSSVANGGYLMLALAASNPSSVSAILFYLIGYVAALMVVFAIAQSVFKTSGNDDISSFAGLGRRSPFAAFGLTLGMVSLAGIPPLVGFMGKFMIVVGVIEEVVRNPNFWWCIGAVVLGVVISIFYYFTVIRYIFWPRVASDGDKISLSLGTKGVVFVGAVAMLGLGVGAEFLIQVIQSASLQWF